MDTSKKSMLLPPIVLFFAVIFIVILYFFNVSASVQKEKDNNLQNYINDTQDVIRNRLNVYQETLRAGVGFYAGSTEVSKQEWQRFMNSTSVMTRYPGAQGIGFTKVVKPADKQSFERRASQIHGFNVSINPEGPRDPYTSILYLEPQNERNDKAIGYDMFSDPTRRRAMEAARDSGEVYVSDSVVLVQENGEDVQYGFLMYAPLYGSKTNLETVSERQNAISGYVYAAFRARNFLSNVLGDRYTDNFAFEVTNTVDGQERVLYASDTLSTIQGMNHDTKDEMLSINGSAWKVKYYFISDSLVSRSVSYQPTLVLLIGVIAAVLVSGVAYLLLLSKANELLLDKERDIISAKDSLLSIASHQLRTPATGVKQYLGMVLQGFVGDISPQQQSMLDKAYESNERQLKTINDVLYLARLDSGRIVLSKSVVDLKKLIQSICDELEGEIVANKHTLKKQFPSGKILVKADEHMLRMAVENLLTNAIKYMQPGGKIALKIETDRHKVKISVSDKGVGIDEKDIKFLFKEFSRIPNEMSKSVSGTGIGLYLTRHLIELHNGKVIVESEPGEGSTFTIVLPKGRNVK